jgi:hypothetical protein
MIVRETIHHGDYYNVRHFYAGVPEYKNGAAMTFERFTELLASSPYNGGKSVIEYAANTYVSKAYVDLLTTRRADYGWARYEVIEKNESEKK